MAKYSIESSTLTNIANAIRAKTGGTENIPVSGFASQIAGISTGKSGIKVTLIMEGYNATGTANGVPFSESTPTEIEVINGSIGAQLWDPCYKLSGNPQTNRGTNSPACGYGTDGLFSCCFITDPTDTYMFQEYGLQEGDVVTIKWKYDD